jgi:protein-histidine N-methyltransferase
VILDWLTRNGAAVDRLLLAGEGAAGRGLRAREDVEAGARVLVVPRACVITAEVARGSPGGAALAAAGALAAEAQTALAACLLGEQDEPRSFWRPYLDAMPPVLSSSPLFYGEAELALLQGSSLLEQITARRASVRHDFEALRAAGGLAGASFDAFVGARFLVSSRVFSVVVAGWPTLAMVPLADMANHRIPPEVRWGWDDASDAFVMTAARDLRAGEPVHAGYGRKCNGRLLLSYGFVLDDNPDDEAAVRLSVPRGAPGFEAKLRLLGAASSAFLVRSDLGSEATRRALAFLRVAHAGEAELRAAGERRSGLAPLGPRSEAGALRALAAACAEALGRFPETLEEDDARLRDGGLGPSARACIVVRRGEKRVLHRLRATAESRAAESPRGGAHHP